MMTQKTQKNPLEYSCENCDFKCCNKKDFKRHLATEKHKMMTNDDTKMPENSANVENPINIDIFIKRNVQQKCITVMDNDTPSDLYI